MNNQSKKELKHYLKLDQVIKQKEFATTHKILMREFIQIVEDAFNAGYKACESKGNNETNHEK